MKKEYHWCLWTVFVANTVNLLSVKYGMRIKKNKSINKQKQKNNCYTDCYFICVYLVLSDGQ